MAKLILSISIRLLVCAAVALLFRRMIGLVGLVVSAPLFGVLLARPLLDLAGELKGFAKALALSDVQGSLHVHRGVRIFVKEDVRHHRWVSIDDIRKLVPSFPRAQVLKSQFPEGVLADPSTDRDLMHANALLEYLGQSTEDNSIRLRNWLDREVVRPAAKVRERLGIRDQVPVRAIDRPNAP